MVEALYVGLYDIRQLGILFNSEFKIFEDLDAILEKFVGCLTIEQYKIVENLVSCIDYTEEEKMDEVFVYSGKMVRLDELYDFLKNKDLYDEN